jgi:WD40 repeat protein
MRLYTSLFIVLVLSGIRDESLLAQSLRPAIATQNGKTLVHAGDTVIVTSPAELKDGKTTLMVLQPNTRLIAEAVTDDRYWLQVSVSRGTKNITGWIQAMDVRKGAADISGPVGEGIQNDDASLTLAESLISQGEKYFAEKDYARVESLDRQALEIRKKALGEDHPDYALSLNNLANLHYSERDYARAEPLYRQALEIRKTALGENHPDYATSLEGLAGLYQARGEKTRAEPLLRQAAEIRKKAVEKPILVLDAGGHTSVESQVLFTPDGKELITVSGDKTIRIWDVATGEPRGVLRPPSALGTCGMIYAAALSPDGTPGKVFEKLGNGVTSAMFSADSRELLFTRGVVSALCSCSLLDLASGRERLRFTRHNNSVCRSDVSPDGSLVATSGGNDHDIFVWRRTDGSVLHRLAGKGRGIYSAAWSPDGTAIAWGNTNWGNSFQAKPPLESSFDLSELAVGEAANARFRRGLTAREGTQLVWKDNRTVAVKQVGQKDVALRCGSAYDMVRCAALLPGHRAAVGSSNGLFVFDIRSGNCLRRLAGHASEVFAVAPSPDGRYLLSASLDQTLQVWDLRSYRWAPLLSLFAAGDDWIAWTPEGYYAASPGGENLMGWQVNHGADKMATFYPAAEFRKSLYRPDVIRRVLEFGNVDQALAAADKDRGKETHQASIEEVLPPLVAITSPDQPKIETQGPTIDVQFTAKPVGAHPITAVRLLVNGRPYPGVEGIKRFDPPRTDEVRDSWLVRLASGENRIAVQAESAVSNAVSEPVMVTLPVRGADRDDASPEERKALLPSLYILAVGISEYPEKLQLNYAAEDAKALAETCQKYSQDMYRKLEVKLLTDKQATRREVLRGLTWLRQQMTQNDVGILFFAGHGTQDADGKGTKRRTIGSLTDDLVRDLATDDFGVIGMCSCMAREYALESPALRHGYFTGALVEGLSGNASRSVGGAVCIHHLNAYVTDRVKELSNGRQHPVTAMPSTVRSFPITKP